MNIERFTLSWLLTIPKTWGGSLYYAAFSRLAEKRRFSPVAHSGRPLLLPLIFFGLGFFTPLQSQQVDGLGQGANGSVGAPLGSVEWISGNLNAAKAHLSEGMTLPYRLAVGDLLPGTTYCVTIAWETRQKGRAAIDFLTTYDRTAGHAAFGHPAEPVDPLRGTALEGSTSLPQFALLPAPAAAGSPVPGQPAAAFNALTAEDRRFAIFNGRINNIRFVEETPLDGDRAEAALEVCFELLPGSVTAPSVVLAWGGHLASGINWGEGMGAASIRGGNIKTFLAGCTGLAGCGTRTVSVQPSAIAAAGVCSISGPASICPGTEVVFSALGDGRISWDIQSNEAGAVIKGPKNKQTLNIESAGTGFFDLELSIDRSIVCTRRIYVLDGGDFGLTPAEQVVCQGTEPAPITWTGMEENSVIRTFRIRDARGRLLAKGLTEEELAVRLSALTGTYFVYGFVRAEYGNTCGVETEAVQVTINQKPSAAFEASATCSGQAVVFEDRSSVEGGSIVAWAWDFAGQGSSTEQQPAFTFPAPGAYEVSLVVTDEWGCQDDTTQTLFVHPPPEPDFTIAGACSGEELVFTDLSRISGDLAATYEWDFGDGSTGSTLKNPAHIYQQGGAYMVRLRVSDAKGCSTVLAREINIRQAPQPGFSTTALCADQEIQFTNTTAAGDVEVLLYEWQFGDGFGSLLPDPVHTYARPGTYSISLTATDGAGCTAVYVDTVEVSAPPLAGFEATAGCLGESISFLSTSTGGGGTITAYRWQFGDGTESAEAAPEHRYVGADTYEVVLSVTNDRGCSDDYTAAVTVFQPVEIAAGDDLEICENTSVQLSGSVGGGATRALWSDNGAGGTFLPRASVLAAAYFPPADFSGPITLTLTSEDPQGPCPPRSDELKVQVHPEVSLEAGDDQTVCAGTTVQLNGAIEGSATAAQWSDGGLGGRFEPSATAFDARYLPPLGFFGDLLLTLVSDDPAGPCMAGRDSLILTVVPPIDVRAGGDREVCAGLSVLLEGRITGDYSTAGWSDNGAGGRFEPSPEELEAVYFPPAEFEGSIVLTLSASAEESPCPVTFDELTLKVHSLPVADFSAEAVCHRQAVDFTNLSGEGAGFRYEWDFGDGATSTERSPSHVFPAPGSYQVTLTVSTPDACIDQITRPVVIYSPPSPDFAIAGDCAGQTLALTDLSDLGEEGVAVYEWDFGDGATSTEKNPVHAFAEAGAYDVKLRITNARGCVTALSREVNISAGPAADFVADPVCEGSPMLFIQAAESSDASITAYRWDFGDGGGSTEANPSHTYAAAGVYPVTLIVTDSKGCNGAIERQVEVYAAPVPAFETDGACLGQALTFGNLSEAGAFPIEQYLWEFGDGSGSQLAEPVHEYDVPGVYTVRLTLTDGKGCSAVEERPLTVGAPPVAGFSAEAVCEGGAVVFSNRSQAGSSPLQFFEWQFGDGASSTQVSPRHLYSAPGLYDVLLTVIDANGCSHSVVGSVEVLEAPEPDFSTEVSCAEGSVSFSDLSASDGIPVVRREWDFGDGTTSQEEAPVHVYAAPGDYEVVLTITDNRGCSASLPRQISVPPPPQAAFTVSGGCAADGVTIDNQSVPATPGNSLQSLWIVRDARDREVKRSREEAPFFDLPPGSYRIELTILEEGGCAATATQAVEVYSTPVLTVKTEAERVCQGERVLLTASLEGGAPCEPMQWERARDAAGPWQRLANSAADTYTTAADLEPGVYFFRAAYRCAAAGCGTVLSNTVEVTVGTGSPNLACNNNVRLTLRSACRLEVSPAMVAEGSFGFCFPYRAEDFEVIIYDGRYDGGQADNRVDGWGVFPYKLQLKASARQAGGIFVPCWGELTVTDETPPQVECPADVTGLIGDENGHYRPALRAQETSDDEVFHFLLCEEQSGIYNEARSWNDPTYTYYTGRPVASDACGEAVLVKVNDRLEQPGCTEAALDFGGQVDSRLVRTFTYADPQGNTATCDQTIYFFRPRIELPPCEVALDWCNYGAGQDLDPQLIGMAPYYLTALGERRWLTGYTCGFSISYEDDLFPGEEGCGFTVRRRWTILDDCRVAGLDAGLIEAPAATCSGEYGWEGNRFLFEQWLRVEDNTAPVVTCPPPSADTPKWTFSTGVMDCSAVVVPAAPVVEGECREWSWEFELFGLLVDPLTRLPEYKLIGRSDDRRLSGVPPGEYDLVYIVRDACGNETRSERCPVLVVDGVAPTAICEDDLQVSLGSGNTDGFGVATLLASNIGNASSDNCGLVELNVRRSIEAECLDIYVQAVTQTELLFDELRQVEENGGTRTDYYFGQRRLVVEEGGVYYSPWAASVFLVCCDSGADGVTIELRATDSAGLSNVCTSTILVDDQLPPRCSAADRVIACTELDFDPRDPGEVADRFGAPETVVSVFDNCGASIEERLVWMPANCGTGLLERIFTVTDAAGQSAQCSQTITVEGVTAYSFRLPGDAVLNGCSAGESIGLNWQSDGCDLLAVSRDTLTFEEVEGACRRLMITYEVINWCEYDAIGNTTPTRIARDADNDDWTDEPIWVVVAFDAAFDAVVAKVFAADAGGGRAAPPLQVYRPGDQGYNPGYYTYTQFVDISDNTPPQIERYDAPSTFCSGENTCTGDYRIELTIRDDCALDASALRELTLLDEAGQLLDALADAPRIERAGERLIITGALPPGDYSLSLRVADACQNFAVETVDFRIEDCTPPAPVCRGLLPVDLAPVDTDNDGRFDAGQTTLPFDAFIASSISDCSPFADEPLHQVKYYLSREAPRSIDDLQAREITFTCADEGIVEVFVTALDAAGNYGTCSTRVAVNPGNDPNPCEEALGDGAVAGLISTEWDDPVEEVLVRLSGPYNASVMTDANGMYAFEALEEGYDYTLAPLLDREYVNGVTTFDLLQISKHILAEDPLDSPYQLLAADANNSGSVTSFDLIQFRKLILTLIDDLPDNTSWRFVDGAHRFTDPADPWKAYIPEVLNINDLAGQLVDRDFVAVKVGDVNGTARTSSFAAPEIRSAAGSLDLFTADRELQANATYRVPVRARHLAEIAGCQFTMEWDSDLLELADVEYGLAEEEHLGTFASDGVLTSSWLNGRAPGEEATTDALFTLVFRARRQGRLSRALWLTSRYTPAEAYDRSGGLMEVLLAFDREEGPGLSFELLPPRPNPWLDYTVAGFTLPEAGPLTLSVLDAHGRLLRRISGEYERGYHELRLNRGQLPAGVLYLTLESARQTLTRKMVLIGRN